MNGNTFAIAFRPPSIGQPFMMAAMAHMAMFYFNPVMMKPGHPPEPPALMQVEYRDALPDLPKPKPPEVKKEVVKKAKKAGLSLAPKPVPPKIQPVKKVVKAPVRASPPPAARTRPSKVVMPEFVPRASEEEIIPAVKGPTKLATATELRPASNPFDTPKKLTSKSRGISAGEVDFKLTNRSGGISGVGSPVVAIPIGQERSEEALVGAPVLQQAPKGRRAISNPYVAPLGEGVGELAGKNRAGYIGRVQVGLPSDEEVLAVANARSSGNGLGRGFEIGGPIGDRKVLRREIPEYPAWAEEKGISATVKIFFTVRADGHIRRSIRVVHSSGYAELDTLAKQALLAWKFTPTEADSNTEEAWGVITFRFTLA